jgi:hypothetical protein
MTDREVMQQALEALTYIYTETTADEDELIDQAITALRKALEQPEQEPGAKWIIEEDNPDSFAKHPAFQPAAQPEQQAEPVAQQYAKLAQHCTMLEHKLAQRKPLTPAEIAAFVGTHGFGPEQLKWFRLGEAAHGIKGRNT